MNAPAKNDDQLVSEDLLLAAATTSNQVNLNDNTKYGYFFTD